ncbi:MAG: hypothetical protein V3U98_08095 [Acidobacteriota bacterium]
MALLALVLGGLCSARLLAQEEPSAVLIRGRVQSENGEPLAGLTVTLIRTHKKLNLRHRRWEESEAVLDRARTDAQGFYEIHAVDDGSFTSYFLRFNDPQSFDSVRYVAPPDEDITRRVRRGRDVVQNLVALENPDWPRVRERLVQVGEGSSRGRILRKLGLPERILRPQGEHGGREEWWYYRRGIVYQFEGARAVGERRFEAIPEPPNLGGTGH